MNIGGFQKNSLIDFPGQIAAVVFTSGCNFICPYCHNPALAAAPVTEARFDLEEILTFLKKRQGMLQGLAITGGEPTLQKGLAEFCLRVKEMGYQIKLDSNGTRPSVLAGLFDRGLVDYLAMDIKTDPTHYPRIMKGREETVDRIRESISLIMDRAPAYEFRTTCARPFISREIMPRIGEWIAGAELYILQACSRNVDVLDSDFLTDDAHFFTDTEMAEFQSLAAPFVKEVRIR